MKQVKVAVIGVGNMGSAHAKMLAAGEIPGAVLAAVCDIRPARLDWARGALGENIKTFDDAQKLMESGCADAVIVATPHYLHPVLGIEALRHGLHLLVEKPEGVYTKQVKELNVAAERAAKEKGLVFGVMFNQRTNPLYRKARDLVRSGELGELRRTNWIITDWFRTQSYYDSGGWRATWAGEGGGVLMNQSPHQLDLWQWICGMPARVRGFCKNGAFHRIEVEDDVTAYVEYPNGATGVFVTSTGDTPGTNRFEITGENGKLLIENDALTFWRNRIPSGRFIREAEGGFEKPEVWKCEIPTAGENPQHAGILKSWTAAILTGAPLLAPGEEGIRGVTLCNAIYLSSWTDQWVTLPLDDALYYRLLQEKIASSTFRKETSDKTFDLAGTYSGS